MKDIFDRLMKGTKDDMMEAAMRLGLPPIKQSAKKAEWAEYIMQGLDEYGINLLLQLKLDAVDMLNAALKGGTTFSKNAPGTDSEAFVDIQFVLEDYGLLWQENGMYRVEPRVTKWLELDEAGRAQQRLQDNLYSYMQGWLLHVGMMPMDELLRRAVDLLELPEKQREDFETLCYALLMARSGKGNFFEAQDGVIWAVHDEVEDPERLLQRLQEPHIAALNYPDFDEDMLVFAAEESLMPGELSLYRPLLEHLEACGAQYADALIGDAVALAQNERVDDALYMILEDAAPKNEKETRKTLQLVNELFNNIPSWVNKGYSAAQLAGMLAPRRMQRMPGRNDPCPCGSGRKYKQCCGKRLN